MIRIDQHLLEHRVARRGIAAVATCGIAQGVTVIVSATLLARIISDVFQRHATLGALRGSLALFGLAILLRAALVWLGEGIGHRTAAALIAVLRRDHLRRLLARGPLVLAGERAGEVTALLTTGLDALDAYFARLLPQTIVAVAVPGLAIAYVLSIDWVSAVILLVTVPLIPAALVIVGWMAERSTRRRWQTFQLLGGHFLDVIQGLPTLRLFGRGPAQIEHVREMSRRLRRTTMETLRVAFLSSFALELLASLGTALLAVTVAVRLVDGGLDLRTGLTVLILAPDVYLPLRNLGAAFHGSMAGVAALRDLSAISAAAPRALAAQGARATASPSRDIVFERVSFAHDGNRQVLRDFSATVETAERVLICGSSGAGKTSLLLLILGLLRAQQGQVLLRGVDAGALDLDASWAGITWLPQSPHIFHGTIAANVRLGAPDAGDAVVRDVLDRVGATFVAALPGGIETLVGERGANLSGGQRQRIALARTLLRTSPVMLLDEPLAHLDVRSRGVASAAIEQHTRGCTVVVAAHDATLFPWIERTITLRAAEVVPLVGRPALRTPA